jgi:cytochrome c5
MLKKTLVPLMLAALLAACGNKQEAAAPAPAPAPAPATQVAAAPAAAAPADNPQGEKAFKGTCAMCHQTGAGGAPVVANKDDWAPRIAQGKDTLYAHAINGYTGQKGAMPPKGANASLADADVKAAVDYMVAKSQ